MDQQFFEIKDYFFKVTAMFYRQGSAGVGPITKSVIVLADDFSEVESKVVESYASDSMYENVDVVSIERVLTDVIL